MAQLGLIYEAERAQGAIYYFIWTQNGINKFIYYSKG